MVFCLCSAWKLGPVSPAQLFARLWKALSPACWPSRSLSGGLSHCKALASWWNVSEGLDPPTLYFFACWKKTVESEERNGTS